MSLPEAGCGHVLSVSQANQALWQQHQLAPETHVCHQMTVCCAQSIPGTALAWQGISGRSRTTWEFPMQEHQGAAGQEGITPFSTCAYLTWIFISLLGITYFSGRSNCFVKMFP